MTAIWHNVVRYLRHSSYYAWISAAPRAATAAAQPLRWEAQTRGGNR